MTPLDSFIDGIISGIGMVIVMTIFGFLTFKLTKNWITKTITEIWVKVKDEGIRLDGIKIDGSLKTKLNRRDKNNQEKSKK